MRKTLAQPTYRDILDLIYYEELNEDYIIPAAFDERVGPAVAKAVADAARYRHCKSFTYDFSSVDIFNDVPFKYIVYQY